MGKLSSGCDIVFKIGDQQVEMGSTLTYDQSTVDAIANVLMDKEQVRQRLAELVQGKNKDVEVTESDLTREGFVPNATARDVASLYPDLDWDGVDQSVNVFMGNWVKKFGQDMTDHIVTVRRDGETRKIYVLNPSNMEQVNKLREHLRLKSRISEAGDDMFDKYDTKEILEAIHDEQRLKRCKDTLKDVDKKLQDASDKEKKSLGRSKAELELEIGYREQLAKIRSMNGLVDFYIENKNALTGLFYRKDNSVHPIGNEIENIIREIQGRQPSGNRYNDVFANTVTLYYKPEYVNGGLEGFSISRDDFDKALINKRNTLGEDQRELIEKIDRYLDGKKDSNAIREIVDVMIHESDDEFSYEFVNFSGGRIRLKNVPLTIEQRIPDFSYATIEQMVPKETYKGYTIYQGVDGLYYGSRHAITGKSYDVGRKTIDEVRRNIDYKTRDERMWKGSLINLKLRTSETVELPNGNFKVGQVIKSLNMRFNVRFNQLNEFERDMIYKDTAMATLPAFHDYVMSITGVSGVQALETRARLESVIDTTEKAACFIYALNELEGKDRVTVSIDTLNGLLRRISDAGYEYFIVDDVNPSYVRNNTFKVMKDNIWEDMRMHSYTLTPVLPSEMSQGKLSYDTTGTPISQVRLLRDLAQKMQDKLGVTVHVESQSDIEQLFRDRGIGELPPDTRAFILDGEIYVNMSNASRKDLFHEYTHLMLGVLKATNIDNYYQVIETLKMGRDGNGSRRFLQLKEKMKLSYPYLSDSDLDEEVFAELFAKSVVGENIDDFLDGVMKNQVSKAFGDAKRIFGKEQFNPRQAGMSFSEVLRTFSHDLGILMNEGNGLEIGEDIAKYRQASNWISDQIREYSREESEIGIEEKC